MKNMKFNILTIALILISSLLFAATNTKLLLSQFSDYHSHALSFYANGESNIGGIARIIGYLKELNENEDTLVFCGGDMVNHGTPAWSDKYQYTEFYWLNNLIDAMAYGNHEGDYGRDAFNKILKDLSYPVLCSNLVDEDFNTLYNYEGKTYVTFNRNDVKVGVFALAGDDFNVLVKADKRPAEGAFFANRADYAREVIADMQAEGCDLIVLIGHALEEEDIALAQAVDGIDIIFGSHSHVKREFAKIEGTNTYMLSPSQYGEYFSNVEVRFDKDGNKSFIGYLVKMDSTIPEDQFTALKVAELQVKLEGDPEFSALFEIIGEVDEEISAAGKETGESEIGNLVTDLMRRASFANFALSTSSSFRASLTPGKLNYEGLKNAIPYKNAIYTYDMTGEQIMEVLECSFSRIDSDNFSQVSGVLIKHNEDGIVSVKILKDPEDVNKGFEDLDMKKTYKVATTNYQGLYAGGYKDIFGKVDPTDTGIDVQELVAMYFQAYSNIRGYLDGRIEFVESKKKLN